MSSPSYALASCGTGSKGRFAAPPAPRGRPVVAGAPSPAPAPSPWTFPLAGRKVAGWTGRLAPDTRDRAIPGPAGRLAAVGADTVRGPSPRPLGAGRTGAHAGAARPRSPDDLHGRRLRAAPPGGGSGARHRRPLARSGRDQRTG